MKRFILALPLALGACIVSPEPADNSCGAAGMQDLVGKDKSIFAAMTLPMGTRIIEPGMAITEDYRPDRLNLDLDANGKISRVWCG